MGEGRFNIHICILIYLYVYLPKYRGTSVLTRFFLSMIRTLLRARGENYVYLKAVGTKLKLAPIPNILRSILWEKRQGTVYV